MNVIVLRAGRLLAASALLFVSSPLHAQGTQRVYVALADSVPMSVPAAASAIADALKGASFVVLADHAVGGDRSCSFGARVIVAHSPAHAASLLPRSATAPFAIPLRLAVYEDERGVHVAMVNLLSIERTIVAESGLEAAGRSLVSDMARLVATATRTSRAERSYGQPRDRGLIGKTMGVMAGGPFAGQVKVLTSSPVSSNADLKGVADPIWERLRQPPKGEWQLRGIYRLDLVEQGVVILGVSGAAMETRAFRIVGAGSDDARSDFKCPGLAHAAAFPVEVIVRRDGSQAKVEVIDAMFRMKMYFEDAGRMKFARNMGMPGSIADELRALVLGQGR
ncbi:MAG TPA: hypothetical protein VFV33_04195 [Gemmatimonadaceae bacterium]|nr:hypothetical protein [Gemmatimonadaceae bacterium]